MNKFYYNTIAKKGFTLMELLISITIIALLATVVIAYITSTRDRARNNAIRGNADTIKKEANIYYTNNNLYGADGGFRNYGNITFAGYLGNPSLCGNNMFTAERIVEAITKIGNNFPNADFACWVANNGNTWGVTIGTPDTNGPTASVCITSNDYYYADNSYDDPNMNLVSGQNNEEIFCR